MMIGVVSVVAASALDAGARESTPRTADAIEPEPVYGTRIVGGDAYKRPDRKAEKAASLTDAEEVKLQCQT
ncbi:hypothetical protein, partial [Streptomyces erythrochromogenes]